MNILDSEQNTNMMSETEMQEKNELLEKIKKLFNQENNLIESDYTVPVQDLTESIKEMELHRKIDMLHRINRMREKGAVFSQHYTVDSDFELMRREYELQRKLIQRKEWFEMIFRMIDTFGMSLAIFVDKVKHKNLSELSKRIRYDEKVQTLMEELYAKHGDRSVAAEIELFDIVLNHILNY